MTSASRLLAVLAIGLVVTEAGAQSGRTPEIDLSGVVTSSRRIKIELENFVLPGLPGEAPAWMRGLDDLVHRDLENSDLFLVTRWYLFPGQPADPASRALVRAVVERHEGRWAFRGRVEALPGQALIFQKEYRFSEADARGVMHRFADDIVFHLTGRVGISQTQVVFSRRNGNGKDLYIVDYDGENLRPLTGNGTLNISPRWSPDGGRVLYTTYENGTPEIAALDVASGERRTLISGGGLNSAAAYAPDGSQIAFTRSTEGDADLFIANADGSSLRHLTKRRGIDTSPSWSPSGREIAFVSDRAGTPQIYVMRLGDGKERRVTFAGSYNDSPSWSPTGEEIAFVSRDGHFMNVYVMSPGGERMRPVVYGRGDTEHPTWAPDGRHLVYSALRDGTRSLFVIDVESGRERRLTTGAGDCYGPAWSPAPPRPAGP